MIEKIQLVSPLLSITVMTSVILGFFVSRRAREGSLVVRLSGVALLGAVLCLALQDPEPGGSSTLFGLYTVDGLGRLAGILVSLAGVVTLFMSREYMRRRDWNHPEIPVLTILAVAGMLVMVLTDNIAVVFLGLEVMSLALYALSAGLRTRPASVEAGMKYFLTGSFASGILLMGMVLLYGATGTFFLSGIGEHLAEGGLLGLTGMLLLLVGFGFKVSAVPFHQWVPDVYEGAPTPVTGFMSTAVKVAAFTALARVVGALAPAAGDTLTGALGSLAVLTMLVGNVGALAQRSVKRMLAYSSVAHSGYLLAGITALAAGAPATGAIMFYLVVYALMNLGAFGILSVLERAEGDGPTFEEMGGLGRQRPVLAAGMLLFMISLAGLPPAGGFVAKWKLLEALWQPASEGGSGIFVLLVVMLVLGSLVGLAYYLRVVAALYMAPPSETEPAPAPRTGATLALSILCAALVLWMGFGPTLMGIGPEGLLSWVRIS